MEEQPYNYVGQSGAKIWYLPSKGRAHWHRLDGPAVEWQGGAKMWCLDGKVHRLDGPAFISERNPSINSWWINGTELCKSEVEIWLDKNKIDLSTEEGQMAFKLRFARQ